jgi:hypothetical protein
VDGEFPLRAFELVAQEQFGKNGVRVRYERDPAAAQLEEQ